MCGAMTARMYCDKRCWARDKRRKMLEDIAQRFGVGVVPAADIISAESRKSA
jgi:hypothetical protein